jgi:hypothetical protein
MPTKYKKRTRRTKSRKSRKLTKLTKLSKSKKIKGGALSVRTIELLRNQYQGINRDRSDRPTILELNQFMMDNNIQEPLGEIMDFIIPTIGFLRLLPSDASPAQRTEEERLHSLF